MDAVVLEYHQLRRGVLSDEYLLNYIDETLLWLGDAIERNFSLWGYVFDLSQYNGMTYLTPVERNATSHAQAVEQFKRFIVERRRVAGRAHRNALPVLQRFQKCQPAGPLMGRKEGAA